MGGALSECAWKFLLGAGMTVDIMGRGVAHGNMEAIVLEGEGLGRGGAQPCRRVEGN